MRILAIEPYYGGSHKAFLDGWGSHSHHDWTLLTLPPYHWKWRMRHAPLHFAEQVADRAASGQEWDFLFCTDMLNLPEFLGLCHSLSRLPSLVYFHENQLSYPVEEERERDAHFGFTNIVTALAADRVWFNSEYHRKSFTSASDVFLHRMPDHGPDDVGTRILEKSDIRYPGIGHSEEPRRDPDGPLHILWVARWEADKAPFCFVEAMKRLMAGGVDFQVSMIGGEPSERHAAWFSQARVQLGDHVKHWGYQESRDAYAQTLASADVVVSTAHHEFFGISVVEAIAAGAYPLLPNRMAYPEVLERLHGGMAPAEHLYDGSVDSLTERLGDLAAAKQAGTFSVPHAAVAQATGQFAWAAQAPAWDLDLETIVATRR